MYKYELIYTQNGEKKVITGEQHRKMEGDELLHTILVEKKTLLDRSPKPDGGGRNVREMLEHNEFYNPQATWMKLV
jgi:hypothetical protein